MIRHDPIAIKVRQIAPLSPTLKHLVLEPADGGLLPAASAGAHLAMVLAAKDGMFRNSYSLVSAPGERSRYELIVRRAARSRGGSAFIHDALQEGAVLHAAAPGNFFPLSTQARKHLLIGGGIGITPMLSFLHALADAKGRFEMHQFCSAAERPVFERLLAPFGGRHVHVHPGRDALDLAALLARQPLGTHLYVCGPVALMDRVQAQAAQLGWPASKIHRELFGAEGGAPFRVRLARSGGELRVGPDETMLEALEAAGAPVRSLCRGGACGECVTGVLDGVPEHRDDFLSAEEKAGGRLIMPCVSRARSPELVIDL